MVNKKLDRLNFAQVYYLIGRLGGISTYRKDTDLQNFADELKQELDFALGYIDTEPKSKKELADEHVYGETLDDYGEEEN